MAEVVEGEHQLADHQRQVRQAERVRVRRAERLDRAHQVVAEEADRAAGERRQQVRLGDGELGQRLGDGAVGVRDGAAHHLADLGPGQRAVRPAQLEPRAEAEERVAPEAPLLGRLEQERRPRERLAELQEGRDGRLAVVDEPVADRDHVRVARPARGPGRGPARSPGSVSRDGH